MFLTIKKDGTTKRKSKKKEKRQYASGIVYLMKMELDCGTNVIKIGVTGRSNVQERFLENVSAFFMTHRYIPRTTLLKFSRTTDYYKAETLLHQKYKENKYLFPTKFQGSSEYFIIEDEDALKEFYLETLTECKCKPKKKNVIISDDDDDFNINDIDPGE